ncbi:MAG: 16S rRNA (guanine(527)-N(7))-methyltransferase RsmG [Oscillospiraceae bacterium]|nr:16S rRNA (guanine(527)-N(7))-methyltransferase RsmG [Oscillospiraceae bacterium]
MILEKEKFRELFAEQGFSVNDSCYDNFDKYSELLCEWNEKINLTAITDPEGISVKHFLDSVMLLKYADIKDGNSLIDVGTGAGFPAIPLKIYRNHINVTLLDSLNKRINFLKTVSDELSLPMECIHSRAEEGGRNEKLREHFDFATARAVAAMPVLCEYCLPFVKVGGIFAAMKGPNEDISAAKNAVKILGGEIENIYEYTLNGDGRMIITVKKISHTPSKYPRNSGQISKKSL